MPMGFGYGYGGFPYGAIDNTPIMRAKFASDDAQYREGQKHQDEQNHTAIKLLLGAAAFAGIIAAIKYGKGGKKIAEKMKKSLVDSAREQAEKHVSDATKGLKPDEIAKAMEKANLTKPSDYEALLNSGKLKGILAGKPKEEQRVLVAVLQEKMGGRLTDSQRAMVSALRDGNIPEDFVSKLRGISETDAKSVRTFIESAKANSKTIDTIFEAVPKLTEDEIANSYRKIWAREATRADVKAALNLISEGWYRRPGKYGKKIGNNAKNRVEEAVKKVKAETPTPAPTSAPAPAAPAAAAPVPPKTGGVDIASKLKSGEVAVENIKDEDLVKTAEALNLNIPERKFGVENTEKNFYASLREKIGSYLQAINLVNSIDNSSLIGEVAKHGIDGNKILLDIVNSKGTTNLNEVYAALRHAIATRMI